MLKHVVENGNYRGYYKFRGESEERVKVFAKDWFQNKVCLDIGCNEGLVTLEIAKQFSPKSILGIDIDKILIESAQSKLKRIIYEKGSMTAGGLNSKCEKSVSNVVRPSQSTLFLPRAVLQKNISCRIPIRTTTHIADAPTELYPHNVHFVCKRFVDLPSSSSNSTEGIYDTVLCLSVVKWIHLNEGDSGLLDFFHRLFHLLRVNGRLVLEFQPWKSYINNKGVNEKIKANFGSILIRPEQFESILVQQVGFVLEGNLGPDVEQAKGFQRPIFVLRRPDPGNHVMDTTTIISDSCERDVLKTSPQTPLTIESSFHTNVARHSLKTVRAVEEEEEESSMQIEEEEEVVDQQQQQHQQGHTKKRKVFHNER